MTEEERHNNKAVYNGEQKIQYTGWFQSKRSIRSIVISMLHMKCMTVQQCSLNASTVETYIFITHNGCT